MQLVKLKFTAYPFQQYGIVDGEVLRVSPDARQVPAKSDKNISAGDNSVQSGFRTIVSLMPSNHLLLWTGRELPRVRHAVGS